MNNAHCSTDESAFPLAASTNTEERVATDCFRTTASREDNTEGKTMSNKDKDKEDENKGKLNFKAYNHSLLLSCSPKQHKHTRQPPSEQKLCCCIKGKDY